ncbi:MAG: ATP-binding protein [Cyclobacteriaceae bacterium]|nr:ATP-binding protein [Cyclobacteriaceae bacterium]
MKLQELENLVSKGEGQLLEFKHKASFVTKIVREMVAFANSQGGELFIGVDDDGRITGLKFAEEERFAIEHAIQMHIKPRIRYQSQVIPINKKRSVLHYRIFESRKKPSYYLDNPEKRGKAYVRLSDKSVQASREMVEILKRSRNKRSYPVAVGEHEQAIFKYIEQHGHITLVNLMKISGLPKSKASQMLVRLVSSNILKIELGENTDYYSMK